MKSLARVVFAAALTLSGALGVTAISAQAASAAPRGAVLADHHRGERHRDDRFSRFCSPRVAIYKAGRMGIRHARVERADRRHVVVRGYRHGRHTAVYFANRHSCPVIGFRR